MGSGLESFYCIIYLLLDYITYNECFYGFLLRYFYQRFRDRFVFAIESFHGDTFNKYRLYENRIEITYKNYFCDPYRGREPRLGTP